MEVNLGNTRGVARKIDKLGRATLPKEYRDTLKIEEEQKVEMFLIENGIYIRKV